MKASAIPVDASTLIYLAKAAVFELAWRGIGPLAVPPAVWREAVEDGERRGAVEVAGIRVAHQNGWLDRLEFSARETARARDIASRYVLGSGESEVLAIGRRGERIIVDEGRATRVAEALGLIPMSTLLLPVMAFAAGKLDEPRAVDMLQRLAIVAGARADVALRLERMIRRIT